MSDGWDVMAAAAPWWLDALAAWSFKASVVFTAAWAACLALRRGPSAARHAVWASAFAAVLALPAVSAAVPGWGLGLGLTRPWVKGRSHAVAASRPAPRPPVAIELAGRGEARLDEAFRAALRPDPASAAAAAIATNGSSPAEIPGVRSETITWAAGALALWAAGAAAAAAPVLLGWARLRALRMGSVATLDVTTLGLVRVLGARLGVRRRVLVIRSMDRAIPMTWGAWRPVLLLPDDAAAWPRGRLTVALQHELAHVRRWDFVTHLVARLACAAQWFNPLAWYALARLRAEQEQACDDLALGQGVRPYRYAEHLLAIVSGREPAGARTRPSVALAMSRASRSAASLERRQHGILDAGRRRDALGRRGLASVSFGGVLTATALAVLSPFADERPVIVELADARAASKSPALPLLAQRGGGPGPGAKLTADDEREALAKILEVFLRPTDESALREGAIRGMLEALNDPHCGYISAAELSRFQSATESRLIGIGAQLEKTKDGKVSVMLPLPDSPAQKAGLRPGDLIDAVDGTPTRGRDLADVVGRIVGKAGTPVRLKIVRGEETRELEITRSQITLRTVLGFGLTDDGRPNFWLDRGKKLGYVRVVSFGPETAANLKEAVKSLQEGGAKGLVLDLRSSPGGLLNAAVDSAQVFLDKGPIVTLQGKGVPPRTFAAEGEPAAGTLPLVVVVDGHTASSAEIVAGALKERGRAVVVGTRTFGKGSVQTIIPLPEGRGAMRITTASFTFPSGRTIDRQPGAETWGVDPTDGDYVPVTPDQEAAFEKARVRRQIPGGPRPPEPVTAEYLEREADDPILAAALRALTARAEGGEFPKVGRPLADQNARGARAEQVRKKRDDLLKELETLDKELQELGQNPAGGVAR